MPKIDLFKDITGLTIFGLEPGEKEVVFAVAGKFDKARILTLLDLDEKHQEIPYGGATIYLTGDGQGAFLSGVVEDLAGLRIEVKQFKIIDTAKGLFFVAQEKGDSFQVRVQVTADSLENAKNMADVVQGFIALGKMSQGEGHRAIPASLVNGLQIKIEGTIVRLELAMSSREFADLASRGRDLSFFD